MTENILKIREGASNKKNSNTGNAIPAAIEDTDTIPVMKRMTRKTPMTDIVSRGCSASRTPKTVATPFPHLKPAKRGSTSPTIAITPVII